jgi:hypothetical protein
MSEITPFDPTIPKAEVERLFRKLADTRLPEIPVVPDAGNDYGKQAPTSATIYSLVNAPQDPRSNGRANSTTTGCTPSHGKRRSNKFPNGTTSQPRSVT